MKKLTSVILATAGLALAMFFYETAVEALYLSLTHRFSRTTLSSSDQIAGIVVLGGDESRLNEAVKLVARFSGSQLIVSGAGENDEATAGAKIILQGRVVIDDRPKNTFENAVFSKELAHVNPGERWILVTSAIHMPRAMGAFRAIGFGVEPYPVDDRSQGLEGRANLVFHEIAGLLTYWLRGRSQSMFPAP